MRVVSVINYKGGVGKTTLTANLGAYLARRGQRVLLIDLDPQSSLTFSFFTPDQAAGNYPRDRTLAQWFASFVDGMPQRSLSEFVAVPRAVNEEVAGHGGFVGLIPSSIKLIDVDMTMLINAGMKDLAADLYVYKLRRALSVGLANPALGAYDFVLIDCPPNFNIVTQSAIVASDRFLVPASPDYLSTLGTGVLLASLERFVETFNRQVADYSSNPQEAIAPTPLGIVFTMVQYRASHPIAAHQYYMQQVKKSVGNVRVFAATVRENAAFGKENPHGVPVILKLPVVDKVYIELMALTAEFMKSFDSQKMRAVA